MRLISAISTLILATALFGCSTARVKPTFTASGNEGYQLVCGGFFETGDLSGCYEKAGEICTDKGYSVTQTSISSIIVQCKPTKAVPNTTQ
jgi:vacuolar-type H+-ATPase subunit B/Vma2